MFRVLLFIIISAVCLNAREGVTSQVHYEDSHETLADIYGMASDVAIVRKLNKTELYRKEMIPVKGKPDVAYEEYVDLYEVTGTIKGRDIKAGQVIKVWTVPAYGYEMTKAYYQKGESESPIVQAYKAVNPVKDGEERILFLNEKEPEKSVYTYRAEEGMASLQNVKALHDNEKEQ